MRRAEADHERLEDHRPEHLPPRRAERAQGGELPRPLRDRDRERVEDDERADEERDAGEREQEVADDRRERRDLARLLVRLLDTGSHLEVAAELRLDPLRQLLGRRAVGGRGLNRVELALLVEQLLRRRHVEDRERRTADRAQLAVLRDPDDLELLRRAECGDADAVAELEALVVGDALVDGDLLAAAGPAALDEVERVEAVELGRGLDPESEGRRAAACRSARRRAAAASSGSPATDPVATSTPSTSRTRASVSSGIGGAWADSPSKLKPASLPVTTASVPAYESTKIASNALSIVSVRT